MGLFSSTKTYVSSTLYNLAGPEVERPNYLKSLIVGNVLFSTKFNVGETLRSGYIRGPGLKIRNYFRWAQDNYSDIGVPIGYLGGRVDIDNGLVAAEIPHGVGETVRVEVIRVEEADYSYWAEQHMAANYPEFIETEWTSDIDETTGDITITFADTTTATFTPVDFDNGATYLYATYQITDDTGSGPPDVGAETSIGSSGTFPSTAGYTLVSHTTTGLISVVETWVYEKTEYMGQDPEPGTDRTYELKTTLTFREYRDGFGVVTDRSTQTDTQKLFVMIWGDAQYYIYKIGSGNAVLDDLVRGETGDGEYVPFIPIRLENEFLSATHLPDAYALAKRAFRKAGGGNLDKIIEKVADHETLDDFDFVYVMYGVSLNCLDNSAREYLYRFFDRCRLSQVTDSVGFGTWQGDQIAYDTAVAQWEEWKLAQSDSLDPLFGDPEPVIPTRPASASNSVRVKSSGTLDTNVDMTVSWLHIDLDTGAGLGKPGAKKGDYWLTVEPNLPGSDKFYSRNSILAGERIENTTFAIHWQDEADSWNKLTVYGAYHKNTIYNKKSVIITAKEALEDPEDSGFLVPLHYATVRDMRLIDSTQMCTACTYLVINTYKVVKTGFFGSTFFKIFIFAAVIALTIAFPPLGGAVSSFATSVGVAVGLTGILATIVGTVIVQLMTMIISKILAKVATAVLGEKFGAIFAAVATFAAVAFGTGLANGQSLSAIWSGMMSAPNLINLSMALGNGIAGYASASAKEFQQKTQEVLKEYAVESKQISQLFAETIGYGTGVINPMGLTDSSVGNVRETEAQFLSRTLMTGTDIAEMSMDMLTDFAELTLSTDLETV